MPFLTLRNATGAEEPGAFYGDERSGLKAGWCGIDQTPLSALSTLAKAAPFHIPEEILKVDEVRQYPVDKVLDGLDASAAGQQLLIYVHGFYIDFEKGCKRATILQENAELQGRFLWFSWPSDGALLNYSHDEADLYWSVPFLAEAIGGVAARLGGDRVNLAGHSLGARGLVLALSELAGSQPDLRLGNVILLAPDMDFEIFLNLLPRIRPMVRSITVYVADADRPLALSAQFHGYPRLGETGNDIASLTGVEVIDLSALQVRSPTGHLYHIYNEEVGADMGQIVREGKYAAERGNLTQIEGNLWSLHAAD